MIPFPFAAVLAQDHLKTALLVNIVNPGIGGLLILGAKGTGKSTIVRAIEPILPVVSVVQDCPFGCDPARSDMWCTFCRDRESIKAEQKPMKIINLPLSTTEDRLIGSVEIEKLLASGKKEIVVGILGEANRNVLYIDEVNLLPDHIVDDILDAAASRWNHIEREGFSIAHPSQFILIGSMNPEEGDLRPQILDRFALSARAATITDPALRVEVIKRNLLFEDSPVKFIEMFAEESELLRQSITDARERLSSITMAERMLEAIAGACADLKVDGQRPDIVIVKTAQTIAALESRDKVIEEDVLRAASMTLLHRTRDGGLLEPPTDEEIASVFTRFLQKSTEQSNAGPATAPGFSIRTGQIDRNLARFAKAVPIPGSEIKKN
ncbi:AAA family ATPase [bacterium]|nr:AAA family ATPase [candidate division CSSED10-310 bacterium]